MLSLLLDSETLVTEEVFIDPSKLLAEDPQYVETVKHQLASRLQICSCRISPAETLHNDGRGISVPDGKQAVIYAALSVTPGSTIDFPQTNQLRYLQPGLLVGWRSCRGSAQLPVTGTGLTYYID
ncbi:hypothetical protein GCM10028806_34180 [Spirosoma terrae]|uniref:Uncharacterized protein n=1 Tax=Spirosoma terrae TaxID=1968276 RepID=A0A6L9L9B7_9BACT|nr:hypothetical protein [Spirosoma terrae]NDU95731.1 hypothetical protein [Spirosoma terrae]